MLNAGVKVVGSFDGWEVAETIHKHNFPDVPFELRWLGKDPEADLQRMIEILTPYRTAGAHIHVHGSPPCQSFSSAGTTKSSIGVSNVDHYLWLIDELKSRDLCDSWSMENVIQARKFFPDLPHEVLWSHDFGVPQKRKRWFAGEGWSAKKTTNGAPWDEALRLTDLPDDAVLNLCGSTRDGSHRATGEDIPQGGQARTLRHMWPTIRTPNGDGTFTKIRRLTADETKVLHGFPDSFTFPSTIGRRDTGIALGNVVSPPVMEGVIRGIHGLV